MARIRIAALACAFHRSTFTPAIGGIPEPDPEQPAAARFPARLNCGWLWSVFG
jgi:nitrite reductase/ring-hydroxylating ferredoxin subunit